MSIAFAQGAVALRSAGTGTEAAAVTIQRGVWDRIYRYRVTLGSGTRREDLEHGHGFIRTLILGKSVENRNYYAMHILRMSGQTWITTFDAFCMMEKNVSRVPKIGQIGGSSASVLRSEKCEKRHQLNGAFKVKFICESLSECPTTSWDLKANRWSSDLETVDAIEKVKNGLKFFEDSLAREIGYYHHQHVIFSYYIRALNCINHDPAYHSTAQEGILATFISVIA